MDKSNRTGGSNGDVMGIEPSFIMGFGMGYSGHQTWLAGNLPFSSMCERQSSAFLILKEPIRS
jgi:hypothetical protein